MKCDLFECDLMIFLVTIDDFLAYTFKTMNCIC